MDEASWAAVEFAPILGPVTQGGTINACHSGSCSEVATELPVPMAVTVDRDGTLYAAINALNPDKAEVVTLP